MSYVSTTGGQMAGSSPAMTRRGSGPITGRCDRTEPGTHASRIAEDLRYAQACSTHFYRNGNTVFVRHVIAKEHWEPTGKWCAFHQLCHGGTLVHASRPHFPNHVAGK